MKKVITVFLAVVMLALLSLMVGARDNTTVEAPHFASAPAIDGVITEAEWGKPTAYAIISLGRRDYARDDEDNVIVSDFCYMDEARTPYTNDISFNLWLRWDEKNFYIGVVSKDKYGLSVNPESTFEKSGNYRGLWDGDALQFGIDPAGANSQGNPSQPYPAFSKYTYILGFTDVACTKTGIRSDAAFDVLVDGAKGEIKWNSGVYPDFGGVANTEAGYTTFEMAIPLSSFDGTVADGKKNGFGVTIARVSGTPSTAVLDNGSSGENYYECWLSWGDGVMGSLKDQLPENRCGANSVVLVDTDALGGTVAPPTVETNAPVVDEPEETTADVAEVTTAGDDETTVAEEDETTAEEEDVTTAADDTTAAGTDKADDTTAAEPTEPAEKKSNIVLWIVLAVVVVAVVVAVIVAATKKKGADKNGK